MATMKQAMTSQRGIPLSKCPDYGLDSLVLGLLFFPGCLILSCDFQEGAVQSPGATGGG